jgi:hypothetical protein
LQAYVYVLRDPDSKKIFYVGKGTGDRVFAHANGALEYEGLSIKNDVIRSIIQRGREVETIILQHGLSDHEDSNLSHAHQTESALYGLFCLLDPALDNSQFSLTNLVVPPTYHEFGLKSTEDLVAQYGEPAETSQIPHNSMLIKMTKTWSLGMSAQDVYEFTRGWWPLSFHRASKVRYVFAIPNFVIRAVYEVPKNGWRYRVKGDRDWQHDVGKNPRVGFDGVDVTDRFPHLVNKSVLHVYGEGQAKRSSTKYLDDVSVKGLKKFNLRPWWNFPQS